MDEQQFRRHFESLRLDATLPAHTVLRPDPPTMRRDSPGRPESAQTRPLTAVPETAEFRLGETIGEGGTAVVRSAHQVSLGRDVAAKTLREGHTERQRRYLLSEATVAGSLEHPNIVPIYTLAATEDGAPVLLMKRVEGIPWSECIDDVGSAPDHDLMEPLEWNLEILEQVCRAVHFAHDRAILHRDIKPENVMLGRYGEVYLVDWGLAVTTNPEKSQRIDWVGDADQIVGTPSYMAPEMTLGDGSALGTFTDVYLLGAVLYEILTGEPPHRGETLFEALRHAYESPVEPIEGSPELVAICQRAMAADPAQRFDSADEMRLALVRYRSHRTSEKLAVESERRIRDMELAMADGTDEGRVTALGAETRFGLRQALSTWAENPTAIRANERWLALMFDWELGRGHLSVAGALLAEYDRPPPELTARLDAALDRARARQLEIEELQSSRSENDPRIGARPRWFAAMVAVVVWTVIPLVGGFMTKWGEEPLTPTRYLVQSVMVIVFVLATVEVLRRRATLNAVDRKLLSFFALMVFFVPVLRTVALVAHLPHHISLATEQLLYGLGFAGAATISGRNGVFPFAVSSAAALVSALHPGSVYLALAGSNFLMLMWIARIWRDQANLVDEVPSGEGGRTANDVA